MTPTSTSEAMAVQPRGGAARAGVLLGIGCALCGVAFWAVAGGAGEARAATQMLYVPEAVPLEPTKVAAPPEKPTLTDERWTEVADPGMASPSADTSLRGGAPTMKADDAKGPITAVEQLAINDDMITAVRSDNMCSRRHAVARAAGLAAGLSMAAVSAPSFGVETKMIKMGSDTGQLVFVPDEVTLCKGDTVTWTNNKGGPHNVVFEEDGVPSGVSAEKLSMDDQLGDEGATYSLMFDTPGTYSYYCEPHAGGGMKATLIVK